MNERETVVMTLRTAIPRLIVLATALLPLMISACAGGDGGGGGGAPGY